MTQILLWAALSSAAVLWPGLALSRAEQETLRERRFRRFGGLALAVLCSTAFDVADYFRI